MQTKHSHKKLWIFMIAQFILFVAVALFVVSSISSYNQRLDEFNTDNYRGEIRKAVQGDIDKSLGKFQSDLDESFENSGNSISDTDLDTRINNWIRYSEGKLESRINVLESTAKYLQSQIDSLRR